MKPHQYNFYATLLDAFCWYQQSESENAEKEFIDKINRVPVTDEKALERMNKGTAMNDLVDKLILGKEVEPVGYDFSADVVTGLAEYLIGSVSQYCVSTTLNIGGNQVVLYGYMDYIKENRAIDLKTTSSYELGKYAGSMQRHIYPICLYNEEIFIDEFEFVVTDFTNIYKEPYKVNIMESYAVIQSKCLELIEFIEAKKHLITDKKIFGLESETLTTV